MKPISELTDEELVQAWMDAINPQGGGKSNYDFSVLVKILEFERLFIVHVLIPMEKCGFSFYVYPKSIKWWRIGNEYTTWSTTAKIKNHRIYRAAVEAALEAVRAMKEKK